jgi:hypothetical protein
MAIKFGEKLKKLVGTVAPILGSAVGGPLGGMAGKMVQDALGVDNDESALEILQTPEGLIKLKDVESQFKVKMKELDVDIEEINHRDRDSARQRQVQAGDSTPQILAYVYTIGFFIVLGIQFYIVIEQIPIDMSAVRILDTSMGILFAMMLASKDYFFGSSSGSKAKTDLLSKS